MKDSECRCPNCGNESPRWVADSRDADIYVCDKCNNQFTVKK